MAVSPVSGAFRSVRKALHWMLYTREELNLRARDRRMIALLDRESVTSKDILEADFGASCPNGLAIRRYPDYAGRFKKLTEQEGFDQLTPQQQSKELTTVLGRGGADDRMYLHPSFSMPAERKDMARDISNTISHEHIHRLQGALRDTGWYSAFNNNNMIFIRMPLREEGLWDKARNLYQKFRRAVVDRRASAENLHTYNVSDYFAREDEIQTRMHEALVQGYAGWQRLPVTKLQLWAAFHNLGLKTPSSILEDLSTSAEGRQALKDFRASPVLRYTTRGNIRHINYLHDYAVFDSNREILWRRALPAIYGNLLELYGDGPGRERMGLGANPAPAIEILKTLQDSPETLTAERLQTMADAVPAERANEFINALLFKYRQKPMPDRAAGFIEALLRRPDVREALNNQGDCRIDEGLHCLPAFLNAVREGNVPVLVSMAHAGIDPFVDVRYCDINGAPVESYNLLNLAHSYRRFSAALAGENAPDDPARGKKARKELQNAFNNEEQRQFITTYTANLGRGLRALEVLYPQHPDQKRPLKEDPGAAKDMSLWDILKTAGVPLSGSQALVPAGQRPALAPEKA